MSSAERPPTEPTAEPRCNCAESNATGATSPDYRCQACQPTAVPDPEALRLRAAIEAVLAGLVEARLADSQHYFSPVYTEHLALLREEVEAEVEWYANRIRAVLGDSGALAEHDAKVLRDAADGLDALSEDQGGMYAGDCIDWLRDRADRLAADAGSQQ